MHAQGLRLRRVRSRTLNPPNCLSTLSPFEFLTTALLVNKTAHARGMLSGYVSLAEQPEGGHDVRCFSPAFSGI